MAQHLAKIFGTEEDKVNCPFYLKMGACRHGERAVREHLAARRADLQLHVHHALHQPDGRSHVDQLARCILARPVPELPALARPVASAPDQAEDGVSDSLGALCVMCE